MRGYAIGVDVGGTKIEADLVARDGTSRRKIRIPTPKKEADIIDAIVGAVQEVQGDKDVDGIGIGTPGFLDAEGRLRDAPNNPSIEGIRFIDHLKRRFRGRIEHDNDANCFALAEYLYGAGVGKKNLVGVIWGTGLGAGLIIDGKIYRGRGGAGEFGHIRWGENRDIESYCSAPHLVRHYRLRGGDASLGPPEIMRRPDAIAGQVIDQALDMLSKGIAALINMLDPDIVVLGGGVSRSNHYRELNRRVAGIVSPALKGVKIVRHKIGDSAGVVGAASLVWHRQ